MLVKPIECSSVFLREFGCDRDVNRILEIAWLPILRVPVRRTYDVADIARQLLAKLHPTD